MRSPRGDRGGGGGGPGPTAASGGALGPAGPLTAAGVSAGRRPARARRVVRCASLGAAGVAFLGESLYVLTAAGGRDVGDPAFDNVVLRVGPGGMAEQVGNLTRYNVQQPPRARQLDPTGAYMEGRRPYGFVAFDGRLYATDGNLETVTEIGPDGSVRRLLEYPASNHVLVGLAPGPDRALYVVEYGPTPHRPGGAKISRLSLDGDVADAWPDLTAAIGVAFGPDGAMYAVEFSSGRRTANTGRLLRRAANGEVERLATRLNFPTALTIGPDGNLYISESGHKSEDGSGRIVRVRLAAQSWTQGSWVRPAAAGLGVAVLGTAAAVALIARRRGRARQRGPVP